MEAFGYVSVIFSVVIGLGMSHILTGATELVKARQRVRFYWVHLLWVALIFVAHIFLWWTMWNLRLVRNWNFFSFLLLLLAPVLLYVAAAFLIPRVEPSTSIDLREYFYANQPAFFSVNAAFVALMGMENWLLTGRLSPAPVTIVFAVMVHLALRVRDREERALSCNNWSPVRTAVFVVCHSLRAAARRYLRLARLGRRRVNRRTDHFPGEVSNAMALHGPGSYWHCIASLAVHAVSHGAWP
jgi:hypothetical protein